MKASAHIDSGHGEVIKIQRRDATQESTLEGKKPLACGWKHFGNFLCVLPLGLCVKEFPFGLKAESTCDTAPLLLYSALGRAYGGIGRRATLRW